jgi:hypothetical protein
MAKKNLAEAAAAILSGNMASLKPMSQGGEAFGQAGATPTVATPGQEGSPQTIQPAIASADEAGVSKAAAAAPTATPPGAKPAAAEPMQKAPPQVTEEEEEEKMHKEETYGMKKEEEEEEESKKKHMKEEEEEEEEEEKSEKDEDDEDDKKAMKEDLDALFHGENLSEDFMNKAATIFEAAVTARVNSLEEKIQEQYAEILEQVTEELKEELTTKVDDYLNYVVEEWVKENELAVESGLRSELTEDFIAGLRNLFVEHYIDIPEEKVDVVEEMTSKVVELEGKLNEQISTAVEMRKLIIEYAKREAIHEICEGLTATQVEKMKSLSEGVEFTTVEDYTQNLLTLRENYFPTKSPTKSNNDRLDEETDVVEETERKSLEEAKANKIADPIMEAYVKSISRTIVK